MDHISDTIYTSFPIKKTTNKRLEGCEIIIWTTTPWTIPANKALAYNKDISYQIIKIEDDGNFKNKKIVIAHDLLEQVLKECEIKKFEKLDKLSGKEFKNIICSHPMENEGYTYDIPMLEANFVTTEQGSGIVHCAPSHGPDDFNLCINNGIQAIETVDNDGKYTKNILNFEGLHVFKANPIIIESLKKNKRLLSNGKLNHTYPHSWRSKAPLIHRATPQWFISMESHGLRKKALVAIDKTEFYPNKGKERLKSMIETRPDWCVSRQRVWGVPLPIFISKKDEKVLVDEEVFNNIANIFEKEGSDCWFENKKQKFLGKKYNENDFYQTTDIVEVWFDSGSTHSFVLEQRDDLKWPASLYLEGSDQHRGWFHSSLLESCGTRGEAPFEAILSHGFVVDGKGLKMSKSLGNVISPEEILKKYGADILRIWVAASNYAEDLRIDHKILEQHADAYRKLRNTFRYLLGNLNDELSEIDLLKIKVDTLPELEQLMLHKLYNLNESFMKHFNSYNIHLIYKELLNFCTVDLSSFYFDIRKDTLYCDEINSKKRKDCQLLLNIILDSLLKWFAPILSFTTEEIFRLVNKNNGEKSIHLKKLNIFPRIWNNERLNQNWKKIIDIRNEVNSSIEAMRGKKIIGSSLEANIEIELDEENYNLGKNYDFSEICITSLAKTTKIKQKENSIKVKTVKAEGQKCSVCWKINKNGCERHSCSNKG